MAGIYIHIPFCKQACHYCDFHFSTNLKKKQALLNALKKELGLRKNELGSEQVETIYFGGGTPSILTIDELNEILDSVYENFDVIENPEITLEANPDDLTEKWISTLSKSLVNRLSIGVQSFFDEDLTLMNRAHNSQEAVNSILFAKEYFENISIDLIYGIQGADDARWKANIDKALDFALPHISSYALTVEPKTALAKFVQKGLISNVDDEQAQRQFLMLVELLENEGYINYEISNFGKPDFFSKNNTAYWQSKSYLGIGPSAHSFNGSKRGWNVRNNSKYIQALEKDIIPIEYEQLSTLDAYNEYVMTGLRTIWGVSLKKVGSVYGANYRKYLQVQAQKYLDEHLLFLDDDRLLATKKGKFLVDGIAADLFMVKLDI